jgi:hypothetical protein
MLRFTITNLSEVNTFSYQLQIYIVLIIIFSLVCNAFCKTYTWDIKIIMFLGSKVRLVRGADNLTAIYEPTV